MSSFITFKRWRPLREERKESELVELVRAEIAPHYKKLPGLLRLELLHVKGTRSYLALQCWSAAASNGARRLTPTTTGLGIKHTSLDS